MNSGILGLLCHESPYQFRGLYIISTIFYLIDLALFVIFSSIFVLRFIMFRMEAYNEIINNQTDMMFCACLPIAWMTLSTLTPLIVSNAYWGHHAFSILGYVMWWMAVGWCLIILFWAFSNLINQHKASTERIPMGIILPAVSVSTAAVTGAFIVSLSYEVSPRLMVPVIIIGYLLLGIGTFLGLMLSTYLFHAYLAQGWPPAPLSPTIFIFIGPWGQGSSALIQLGRAARVYRAFAGYNKGTFLTAEAAVPIHVVSTMLALMFSGIGFVFMGFGIIGMIRRAVRKELYWAHSWNSIIFPTGTLVTSMSLFSEEMDSPTFRVVNSIMLICLVMVFLVNVGFAGWNISQGQLLIVREDPRVKKQMEEEEKDR